MPLPQIRSVRERMQEVSGGRDRFMRLALAQYGPLRRAVTEYNSQIEAAIG